MQLSPECQSLIHGLLRPTPQARITVQGILRHPWVANGMPTQLAGINAHLLHLAGSGAMTGGCKQVCERAAEQTECSCTMLRSLHGCEFMMVDAVICETIRQVIHAACGLAAADSVYISL